MTVGIDPVADLRAILDDVHARCASLPGGDVARYIPELATVDPESFAVAVCTVDGDVVTAGHDDRTFTLQSICKPVLYACALGECGIEAVHARVGVEPTGDAFDSIVQLESGTNRPHNPMVNAGAIAVASLLLEANPKDTFERVRALVGRLAGRTGIAVAEAVFRSEWETGDRNRAIAHLMAHLGMLAAPEQAVETYFRACSLNVTARDLAVMGATLAFGGRHPIGGERVLDPEVVRHVLAVMSTCGMYDGTGRFAVDVGLPAKSGVSGGILVVAPGRLGIGAFAPRIDDSGNSVRGMAAVREIGERRSLHLFDASAPGVTPQRVGLDAVRAAIAGARARHRSTTGGALADYIPALAGASPEAFGIAVCTLEAEELAAGDTEEAFTIQAAANPFTYALALDALGIEAVHDKVGVEPSGNPYNAIVFDPSTRRPYNPLNNAGAITVASLLPGRDVEEQAGRARQEMAAFAGLDSLAADASILAGERRNERNRAIAYLLSNFGLIEDVECALEVYYHQCALSVTARTLARMGATLAANGRNPMTGARVIPGDVVRRVLTVMYTCGMHDASGQFAFDVGVPGKSGITGGIVAVVPGRMGLAVFSPLVDGKGASVRGFAALRDLSAQLRLGLFDMPS